MAILNRLPTKDRLKTWGMEVDDKCCLCQREDETREHLFIGCDYSKEIWQKILWMCRIYRGVKNWSEELRWAVSKLKGKALIAIILRLAWNASIYQIWKEWNSKMFQHKEEKTTQVLEHIKDAVRLRLQGLSRIAADPAAIRDAYIYGCKKQLNCCIVAEFC
ncbi:uncharacterized protein LOC111302625 [Durio zibethinus]|uniref:Uncharacterized protein LOC111302625 n=1 Tax=Durio zibethinus TaxID=66656 RepID=A0A6P5ZMY9_DURZI|nr:uncharacterized protein LOC111302625 [Durio zibethinus]